MKKQILYLLALSVVLINGCQKELSFETSNSPSHGSLQSAATGDCLPKTINGVYEAGKPLVAATNTISVSVDVIKTGSYAIFTDTVNGYYFRGTGIFTALGIATVTLQGNGTPFTAGPNNFVVQYDSSICDLQIIVAPAGAGSPAAYTLAGAPGSCTAPTITGTYAVNTALNINNTVVLTINVNTIGTYNISTTTTNGMNFNGNGSFVTTGPQTVTLNGSGVPVTAGNSTIPVTAGTSTCSFVIPVSAGAVGTLGGGPGACTPSMVNGIYTVGNALSAANTVQVQISVTTAGTYTISTNTVAGFSFSGTGTVTVGPNQLILLTATGTPNASGTQTFTVTFGTSTCTFTVTVASTSTAAYTINCPGVTVNGTYQTGSALGAGNTITLPVTVTTAGAYSISASINGMTFSSSGNLTLATATITLNGTGTPATAGTSNLSVGTPACLIPITVTAAAAINWKFNIGTTLYQGQTDIGGVDYDVASSPPFTLLDYLGTNAAGDDFSFSLIDLTGGITAAETYNSTSVGLTNLGAFYFLGSGLDLIAQPGIPPIGNMVFTITSHNTVTKTIIGIFSGTAFDAVSSTTRTITNGTFTAVYP